MPGFPKVQAKDLVTCQAEQGLQYGAEVALGEKVVSLERREDGVWRLGTEKGSTHLSRTLMITAGAGSFAPRKLPLDDAAQWEGRGIHYFVRDTSRFDDRQ